MKLFIFRLSEVVIAAKERETLLLLVRRGGHSTSFALHEME